MTGLAAGRRAAVPAAVFLALLLVYGSTLARDVTFWDAGEFIAAASSFGIPHPPGTPLYVMLLRSVVLTLGSVGVPAAVATSLVSALCTASACAAVAALLHRTTRDGLAAVAAGITSGTMASVWLNATETEVYAASLALSAAIVWAAERAGRRESLRWSIATAYLLALAVPLHLSALLVAPAAVYLVAGRLVWPLERSAATRCAVVAASCAATFALGQMAIVPGAIAVVAFAAATGAAVRWPAPRDYQVLHERRTIPPALLRGALPLASVAIAASAVLVLLVRAQHDPPVNQGNPATVGALIELVSRRQYDVAALWPRQAPLWLQIGNLGLYADWQVALAFGPTIFPTPLRTGATLLFAALGVYGAVMHRRRDRRSWTAFALLLIAGTIGAALYLNLKAGPSFGHGVLPAGALREARERDYFFVLGWWMWGVWAGFGAVILARRAKAPAVTGLALALLPMFLNWRAIDRTRFPEAALPRATAEGLLRELPPRAVLFVAGDNDTYPLWYAQRTLGVRPDVTVITTPLLPADWYRAELARRNALLAVDGTGQPSWRGRAATMAEIAEHAREDGRPIAMAVSMPAYDRAALRAAWVLRGPVYVEARPRGDGRALYVDTAAANAWSARFTTLTRGRDPHPSVDGTARYMDSLLRCPGIAIGSVLVGPLDARADYPAPHCNFR